MKNKKQLTFWGVIAHDIWFIFRTVFWGIPKATVTQLRNLDYIAIRDSLYIDANVPGFSLAFFTYILLIFSFWYLQELYVHASWLINTLFVLGVPAILLGIPIRYIWYRASLQEEEERVLKHNLEYIELCDDELTEDFYNTVSGSGG